MVNLKSVKCIRMHLVMNTVSDHLKKKMNLKLRDVYKLYKNTIFCATKNIIRNSKCFIHMQFYPLIESQANAYKLIFCKFFLVRMSFNLNISLYLLNLYAAI